ncbi:TPD1 protein homolog 1-like [Olea europaea var. sylvestris]|uniref:TPD1 protein homolog 1-like n=1 Tax=Olea europaea var. sylvestris TaxID=158386 RepID=UPI000C1CD1A1|nr:TPD1 protein homolog 1-like [Olea europaea var. sylvestris]
MKSLIRELSLCNVCLVQGFASVIIIVFFVNSTYGALEPVNEGGIQDSAFSKGNYTVKSRKLLGLPDDDDGYMNRFGSICSKDNILVFQGQTTPLPNGIPTYTVDIQNACTSGSCSISNIHLTCGWFSSARLVNPNVFRRIGYDDCLVNDGEPMNPGDCLSFQYANTFEYPLAVSSVACT